MKSASQGFVYFLAIFAATVGSAAGVVGNLAVIDSMNLEHIEQDLREILVDGEVSAAVERAKLENTSIEDALNNVNIPESHIPFDATYNLGMLYITICIGLYLASLIMGFVGYRIGKKAA